MEEYRLKYWVKINALNDQISEIQGNQTEKTRMDKIKSAARNRYNSRLKVEPKHVQKAYKKMDENQVYKYIYHWSPVERF